MLPKAVPYPGGRTASPFSHLSLLQNILMALVLMSQFQSGAFCPGKRPWQLPGACIKPNSWAGLKRDSPLLLCPMLGWTGHGSLTHTTLPIAEALFTPPAKPSTSLLFAPHMHWGGEEQTFLELKAKNLLSL